MNKKYRKVIIAGNWKMNQLPSGVKPFVEELKTKLPAGMNGCSVVLCVPATHLAALAREKARRIGVGAQNVSEFDKGAHTGEISVDMIADLGAKYCIVGHSERRANNGDTDELVNTKVHALLEKGITPIVCVGESLSERDRDLTMERISYQVKAALYGLTAEQVKKVVIAYEPVWAIGTGLTATDEQANETIGVIREAVAAVYGKKTADKVRIQYGGSMKPSNAKGLMEQPEIDGGLIGGASLKAEDFAKVVHFDA